MASNRKNHSSGLVWEDVVGYSRAVRINNIIEVSGTVAADDDGLVVGKNDGYQQAMFILQKIEKSLKALGGTLNDVVRTRMFVTDIKRFEEFAKAHGEIFSNIKPATSMIEIKSLVEPDYLIEIEATAILADSN
jgi:Putative translation initiation inhibitor, yjgF family